ncbi:MAG: hypothetical protein PVG35_21670 [Desulfobacterales bacterium]
MKLRYLSRHLLGVTIIGVFSFVLLFPTVSKAQDISGLYFMDRDPGRRIVITHLTDVIYRIEEPTSPWSWDGSAIFDGKLLFGIAKFKANRGSMMIKARLRGAEGSLDAEYVFITDAQGNFATKIGPNYGRVDRHVWFKQ